MMNTAPQRLSIIRHDAVRIDHKLDRRGWRPADQNVASGVQQQALDGSAQRNQLDGVTIIGIDGKWIGARLSRQTTKHRVGSSSIALV